MLRSQDIQVFIFPFSSFFLCLPLLSRLIIDNDAISCLNKDLRPTLKDCLFPTTPIAKKEVTWGVDKTFFFFTLFKLNITFYFKCCLYHNCSLNLKWNNTQLYTSKPLHNVPSSVFWFVNFCFLPFLARTSVQKWKKNWFRYVHKWKGKKEMLAKISNSCVEIFSQVLQHKSEVHTKITKSS